MLTGNLQTLISKKELDYFGEELRPHFLLETFGLKGHALVAYEGACEVKTEHLVDWEDRLAHDFIRAKKMLHFQGEFFGLPLMSGVLLQRLLVSTAYEVLKPQLNPQVDFYRSGDDLYYDKKKVSVSIVTASPVSLLLHFGVNINAAGAPVDAIGLEHMETWGSTARGVSSQEFSQALMNRFSEEFNGLFWACSKVKPVI